MSEVQYAEAIKEFEARMDDELSIKPGHKIQVISDDREFNDGWYMGKNLTTNMVGLYPNSFTKVVPNLNNKQSNDSLLRSRSRTRSTASPLGSPTNQYSTRSSVNSSRLASPKPNKYNSIGSIANAINNGSSTVGTGISNNRASHSSVIKTMSEIDQALEDFRIEDFANKRIMDWNPKDVSDYFNSLNYRQEAAQFFKHKITGSILVELELAYLKELEIGPFGTRYEIFKVISNLQHRISSGEEYLEPRKFEGYVMDNPYLASSENLPEVSQQLTEDYHAPKSSENESEKYDQFQQYDSSEQYTQKRLSQIQPQKGPIHTQQQQQQQLQQPFSQNSAPAAVSKSNTAPSSSSSGSSGSNGITNGQNVPKTPGTPQFSPTPGSERQFSPIRKAPLPPGSGSNHAPAPAVTPAPASNAMSTPHKVSSPKQYIMDDASSSSSNEAPQVSSPTKYRSASANEAKSPSSANFNVQPSKRAVSSTEQFKENVATSESSFKVTQVRNAQTTKTLKKTKKQTSAFQEGINQVTPEQSSKTADYFGWMSKKSSSAVGPWKHRFFTLHGTRLSYFGSMKDVKEKGLIDITAHRVLAAKDDDKLVSLYAATTGQGRYCFKLVPPAPGSKKGLTFTQPKVHYFAVETREEMRNWMVALMKATIDLDDTIPTVSTCSTPTVSLQKAQELLLKARENAKLREEQLKAKGFLQPGANNEIPNNSSNSSNASNNSNGVNHMISSPMQSPNVDSTLSDVPVNSYGNVFGVENNSLSPEESSSLNSGNSMPQQATNSTANTSGSHSGTPKLSSLSEIQAAAMNLISPKSPKSSSEGGESFRNKAMNRFKNKS